MALEPKISRRRAALGMLACGVAGPALMQGICRAAAPPIVRVEEDWTLQIGQTNPANNAPLIKTVMSAQADLLGYCASFDVNYEMLGSPPQLIPGGFGVEMWNPGQQWPTAAGFARNTRLNIAGEAIAWTQRLDLTGGVLAFSVRNVTSQTWGATAGEALSVSMPAVPYADLSGYTRSLSVAESGPTWCPKLVTSLTLTAVRSYDGSGNLAATDATGYQAYP